MAKYIYKGKQAHFSTIMVKGPDGKRTKLDVRMANGDQVDLPEDNSVVKSLAAQKLLVPVTAQQNSSTANIPK